MPLNLGAFLGGNNGQGGLMPQIQAAQKAAQERDLQAAAWQAMQARLIPPNQGGTPPVPNQTPMPPQLPHTSGMPPLPQQGGYPPMPGNGAPANLDQLLQQYNTNPQIPAPGSTDPLVRQVLGNPQQQYPPMPQQPKAPPAPPSIDDIAKAAPPDMMTQFMTGLTKANMPDWKKGAVMSQFMQSYGQIAQRQEQSRHDAAMEDIGRMNAGAHIEIAGADVTKANNPKSSASETITLDDGAITALAKQMAKTGKLPQGLGWGQNANKTAVINRAIALNPDVDLAEAGLGYAGAGAEQRAEGTRAGAIAISSAAVEGAAKMAIESSNKVDRTRFPTLNAIQLAASKGTGGTAVIDLNAKTNTLINEYAAAQNPRGVPRIEDKKYARELLETAYSKGQYETGVKAIIAETQNIKKKTKQVRTGEDTSEDISGSTPSSTEAAPDYSHLWSK